MLTVIFIIWLVLAWRISRRILAKVFYWNKRIISWLAVFLPLFVLGPTANIFTAWFKLTDGAIVLSFVLSWLSLLLADKIIFRQERTLVLAESDNEKGWFVFYPWLYAVFGLLAVAGFYLIIQASSGFSLVSPWEVLTGWQLVIISALLAIIIYAIYCRKIPAIAVLLLIVVFSFLVHSYLLVYRNGFGGDRFRHLGSEERIIRDLEYQPTLLTSDLWYQQLGIIKYPQALTDSAKLSYGTMWSLEVIVAKISGLPVFQINRWLLPVLWSFFLTVIIFALAYLLRPDRRFALWSAVLANSFYLFQYYGAQGLPASYGLLWLAFYGLFLLAYLKKSARSLLILLIGGLLLMYFNYLLAFFLAGIGLALTLALAHKKWLIYLLAPLFVAGLLGLDYLSSSQLGFAWSKILPAWSFANLLDFQSLNRLVPLIGEWHMAELLLMVGFFVVLGLAFLKIWRRQEPAWLLAALMAKIILTGYFLSYWFLNGEHSLSRRLTLFAVLFLVLIFADLAERMIRGPKSLAVVGLAAIALTSLTYYSGPALNVAVGDRELDRAQAIWKDIKDQKNYCIKDDISVILALEYVSAKEFQETINNQNCAKE